MAEVGCTVFQIAAIAGHTLKQVHDILERYGVRTTRMAQDAFQMRLAKEKGE